MKKLIEVSLNLSFSLLDGQFDQLYRFLILTMQRCTELIPFLAVVTGFVDLTSHTTPRL